MEILVSTTRSFAAAHRLVGYSGDCSRVHGHTFKVQVGVRGERSLRNDVGMLMDFKTIKSIIDQFDHKTILWDCVSNIKLIEALKGIGADSVFLMNSNPTAENIAMYLWKQFKKLDRRFNYSVVVWESETSFASLGDF